MTKAKYSKPGQNLEVGCSGYGKMPAHMGRDENGKAKSPSVTSSIGMPLNCVCVVILFISGNVKCLPIHQHSNHLVKTRIQSMTKVLSMLLQRAAGAIVAGVGSLPSGIFRAWFAWTWCNLGGENLVKAAVQLDRCR